VGVLEGLDAIGVGLSEKLGRLCAVIFFSRLLAFRWVWEGVGERDGGTECSREVNLSEWEVSGSHPAPPPHPNGMFDGKGQ
jgi:hypothetical protein